MINQLASVVSLAKTIRSSLDHSKESTSIPTNTLDLICSTMISDFESNNPTARAVQAAHSNFISAQVKGVEGR